MSVRVIILLVAAVISAVLLYLVARTPLQEPLQVPPLPAAQPPQVERETPAENRAEQEGVATTGPVTPPWADPAMQREMDRLRAERADLKEQQRELKRLQQELQNQLGAGEEIDMAAVERSLDRLIDIHGSPVVAGVDLTRVKQNLQVAAEIKAIAEEMQNTEMDPEQLQQKSRQLQELQQQLSPNVLAQESAGEGKEE